MRYRRAGNHCGVRRHDLEEPAGHATHRLSLASVEEVNSDTGWFAPSEASFMINYRVDDLDALLADLNAAGIATLKGPESHENGKDAYDKPSDAPG